MNSIQVIMKMFKKHFKAPGRCITATIVIFCVLKPKKIYTYNYISSTILHTLTHTNKGISNTKYTQYIMNNCLLNVLKFY